MEWHKDHYSISDDRIKIDIDAVFELLSTSYWAADRPKEVIKLSIEQSICFGIYCEDQQIGFARVVTDQVVFAWICDLIIHPNFRGNGLGKWLIGCIMEHPSIQVKSYGLATKDAHTLYQKFGFKHVDTMQLKIDQPPSWNQ